MRARLLYWSVQAAGWGLLFVVNLLFAKLFNPQLLPGVAVVYCFCSLSGLALSHGFLRRCEPQRWLALPLARSSWRFALAILVLGCLQTFAAAVWFRLFIVADTFRRLNWLPSALVFWIVIYLLWVALYTSTVHLREGQQVQRNRLAAELLAKDARLDLLRQQINPHFLFNSLNSIRALIYEDTAKAGQMIDKLAGLLRYSLQSGDITTVTLAEELDIVEQYLAIEKIRFEARLQVEVQIEPAAHNARLPPMLLQTLVENAVKHGIEGVAAGGPLKIFAAVEDNVLRVIVSNPGALTQTSDSTRLGLRNATQRLELVVGSGSELSVTQLGNSVQAELLVPQEVPVAGLDRR